VRASELTVEQAQRIVARIQHYIVVVDQYSDDTTKHCHAWTGGVSIKGDGYPVTTTRTADLPPELKGTYLVYLLMLRAADQPMPVRGITQYEHICNNKLCIRPEHGRIVSVVDNQKRKYCTMEALCTAACCRLRLQKCVQSVCSYLHPTTEKCLYPADFWQKNDPFFGKEQEKQDKKPITGRPKDCQLIVSTLY